MHACRRLRGLLPAVLLLTAVTLAPATAVLALAPAVAGARPLTRATWVSGTSVTEYYPVPERWFTGTAVPAPGLAGTHRIDWLYGAKGLSMEGDGVGLDGRRYHIESTGNVGWINAQGRRTKPGRDGWSAGSPFWRAGGYWLDAAKRPTFPLIGGGWLNGPGRRWRPIPGITFGDGPSRPLVYYASLAVDPKLIPTGSLVYLPPYRDITPSRGWFVADDVGGAILGHHVDVYRPAPARESDGGRSFSGVRMRVIPPGASAGDGPPPPRQVVGVAG